MDQLELQCLVGFVLQMLLFFQKKEEKIGPTEMTSRCAMQPRTGGRHAAACHLSFQFTRLGPQYADTSCLHSATDVLNLLAKTAVFFYTNFEDEQGNLFFVFLRSKVGLLDCILFVDT